MASGESFDIDRAPPGHLASGVCGTPRLNFGFRTIANGTGCKLYPRGPRSVGSRMPTIRLQKLAGALVDGAVWEVETLENLREDQILRVNLPATEFPELISYLKKRPTAGVQVEPEGKKEYSVTLELVVRRFLNLMEQVEVENEGEPRTANLDSMAMVAPSTRAVEEVALYILAREDCNRRFVQAVTGSTGSG